MPATHVFDHAMLAHITRRPRAALLSVLAIASITLWLSYTRISSSTMSVFGSSATDHQLQQQNPETETEPESQEPPKQTPEEDELFADIPPMSYGTNARPPLKGLKNIIADLPKEFIPVPEVDAWSSAFHKRPKRLIIVGDVHGQKKELQHLLKKVKFNNRKGDHLILAGDLVNKGRDSAGVVALAMELGAHAVRGNHEDRVLLAHAAMKKNKSKSQTTMGGSEDDEAQSRVESDTEPEDEDQPTKKDEIDEIDDIDEARLSKGDRVDRETARSLSRKQIKWLSELPVILRIGAIPSSKPNIENLVVVHGGLVPNVALKHQDPWAVMNMRSLVYPADELRRQAVGIHLEKVEKGRQGRPVRILESDVDAELARIVDAQQAQSGGSILDHKGDVALPTDSHDGILWTKEWNRAQKRLPARNRTTVVFGHDAKTGLNVDGRYTFGLDSGCVYGRQLSALVIEAGKKTVEHTVVQVECEDAAERTKS